MTRRYLPFLVLLAACAERAEEELPTGPRIQALSTQRIVLGEGVSLYGYNLDPDARGEARVVFEGTYTSDDGTNPVNLAIPAFFDGYLDTAGEHFDVLTIQRLGPFDNPFSEADRPGVFRGKIAAEIVAQDGTVSRDEAPNELDLEIGPSLVVEAFEPIEASCGAPALRALAGVPYKLTVRPVGIKAVSFRYTISNVNGAPGVVDFEHTLGAPVATDTLGESEAVVFNPIPDSEQFYVAAIRVVATDAEGFSVETALPMTVHRPIEVVYGGHYELAQLYEPVPASGCTPGSINTTVTYSERVSETRQRSVSVTVSRNWMSSQGQTQSETWQEGIRTGESRSSTLGGEETEEERVSESHGLSYNQSNTNEVGFEATDGESWSWSMSEGETNAEYAERMNRIYGEGNFSTTVGVEGSGSVPGFAKVTGKASTTVGVRAGASTAGTTGGQHSERREQGYSMGGSSSESRSFGSATTEERGATLNETYSLTNRTARSYSDTESREESRTWDLSEGVSVNESVSEGQSEAEQRTWVDSSTAETTRTFSGRIPRGRVGMFYRQTQRWVRRAEVRSYNLCGLARHVGELQFNEWTWSPELALGESCDSPPPSQKLPAAECIIEPCGG